MASGPTIIDKAPGAAMDQDTLGALGRLGEFDAHQKLEPDERMANPLSGKAFGGPMTAQKVLDARQRLLYGGAPRAAVPRSSVVGGRMEGTEVGPLQAPAEGAYGVGYGAYDVGPARPGAEGRKRAYELRRQGHKVKYAPDDARADQDGLVWKEGSQEAVDRRNAGRAGRGLPPLGQRTMPEAAPAEAAGPPLKPSEARAAESHEWRRADRAESAEADQKAVEAVEMEADAAEARMVDLQSKSEGTFYEPDRDRLEGHIERGDEDGYSRELEQSQERKRVEDRRKSALAPEQQAAKSRADVAVKVAQKTFDDYAGQMRSAMVGLMEYQRVLLSGNATDEDREKFVIFRERRKVLQTLFDQAEERLAAAIDEQAGINEEADVAADQQDQADIVAKEVEEGTTGTKTPEGFHSNALGRDVTEQEMRQTASEGGMTLQEVIDLLEINAQLTG